MGFLFRMAPDDRDELRRKAEAQGLTVQAYLERVALGRADARPLRVSGTARRGGDSHG